MAQRTDIVDDDELVPGTPVGEYVVDGQLGEGGMGTVYAATHPVIAKRAAIKVLHPALSVNREAVERFVQEARSVNQISHPNIVDIFAFGTLPDGRSYFVMERLHGESLRERMARGSLPLADTLAILETITLALEAAHERGVIHRDLKPDNIYLVAVKHGQPLVKLLDFGIAKLVGSDRPALSHRTRTGNLLGTPAYMSPEQARGQDVDHRTDIYALGAVAFELVTGQLPYPADNGADMIAKHLQAPVPSVASVSPQVPPALDRLIQRMLDKEAGNRPTLAQLRDQLHTYRDFTVAGVTASSMAPLVARPMATPRPVMSTAPGSPRRWWPIGAAIAFVAVVATIVFVAIRGGHNEPEHGTATTTTSQGSAASVTPSTTPSRPIVEPITTAGDAGSARSDDSVKVEPGRTAPTDPRNSTKPTTRPASSTKPTKPAGSTKPTKPTKPSDDDDAPM